MKRVHNPYYGYGIHAEGDSNEDIEYCEVRKQHTPVKEVANPTYGMTESEMKAGKGTIANPLYGMGQLQVPQGKDGMHMSTSGVYSEVPISRDDHVYDAPH